MFLAIRKVAGITPVNELGKMPKVEPARADKTVLDSISEVAETMPIDELEMMYQAEIARAKKLQWVLDEQEKENQYRQQHIVFPGKKYPPEPITRPLSILGHLRPSFPYQFTPNRLGDHGPCTRADCPVGEPHLMGLYFHHDFKRAREPWPYTEWFGYSQAPSKVWDAVRRLEEAQEIGKESEEDVKMVTGFRNYHYWEAREGPPKGLPYEKVVEQELASWKKKIIASRAEQSEEQAKQLEKQAAEEDNLHLRWAFPLKTRGDYSGDGGW